MLDLRSVFPERSNQHFSCGVHHDFTQRLASTPITDLSSYKISGFLNGASECMTLDGATAVWRLVNGARF